MDKVNLRDEEIKNVLNFDPLDAAEKLTQTSYKENDETIHLGMCLAHDHNKAKNKMLKDMGDTCRSMKFSDYIKIIETFGFKKVYGEVFKRDRWDSDELFQIYFEKKRGILLAIDSFGENINSSHFFFQHILKTKGASSGYSSGGFDHSNRQTIYYKENGDVFLKDQPEPPANSIRDFDTIVNNHKIFEKEIAEWAEINNVYPLWTGYNHGVEAIIFQIKQLDKSGIFLKNWTKDNGNISSMNIYLHDHQSDKEWADKESIGSKRIDSLPNDIKKSIGIM